MEKFDGYTLVAKMRKARRKHCISAGAQGLFHELWAICNEDGWPKIFKCRAGDLCSALGGITEKTLAGYRDDLILAGLIGYLSGKSRREHSYYSLHGGSFDSNNGVIFYHQTEYPSYYQVGEKITDNKNKLKKETKTKTFQSSDSGDFYEAEKERLIEHFCNDKKSEKEKNSAEKEKPPTAKEADTAFKNLYISLYELIRKDNPERAGTDELRFAMLELFWQENIDDYTRKFPPWKDIITHFRNWIPKYTIVKKLQENGNKLTHAGNNSNAKPNAANGVRQRTEDKRNELRNLKDGSTEFLRRADG